MQSSEATLLNQTKNSPLSSHQEWEQKCISPSNEYSGLISFRMDWFDLLAGQGTLKSPPAPQFASTNSLELSLFYGPTVTSIMTNGKP